MTEHSFPSTYSTARLWVKIQQKKMRESCPSTLGKKSRYLQDSNCLGIRDLLADKSKFNLRMSRSPAYPEKKSTITNILKLYTSLFRM
jgi:hypothetical protein